MSAIPKLTPQDYLVQERIAETKSEYIAGEIFAMAGGSPAHNLISANAMRELGNRLKQRPCRVYSSDQRVAVADAYVYPDVSVVCGQPEFSDDDNLVNPTLIVEVLSKSTEDYDLGGKFARYRQVATLSEYLTIAQDRVEVLLHQRQAEGRWLLSEITRADALIELPGVGCQLSVAELYHQVFD